MKNLRLRVLFILLLFSSFLISCRLVFQPERTTSQNFSFIQVSDLHSPMKESGDTISLLKNTLSGVKLEAYNNLSAPAPSFIIATGDLTEYGGLNNAWETYLSFFQGINLPVYHQLGNHDNTWYCGTRYLRQLYGSPNYSFNRNGIHFIGICTPTYQEPLPSFGVEALDFLKKDLAIVGKKMPVIIFFHHLLDSPEFSSRYDVERFLDILKPYNVILLLVGHGHFPRYHNFYGFDSVEGGTTFGANAGYAILSFMNDTLRVVYKYKDPTKPPIGLLEKKITQGTSFPDIKILSLQDRDDISDNTFKMSARIDYDSKLIKSAGWTIDDKVSGKLILENGEYRDMVNCADLIAGSHYLRVSFTTQDDKEFNKSLFFYKTSGQKDVKWRSFVGGSIKTKPLIYQKMVFFGANDGCLYCLDKSTGQSKWKYQTGAEILSSPANYNDIILFGSADGYFYAVDTTGNLKWKYNVKEGVYSSPITKDGVVYFGVADGRFIALNVIDGTQKWVYDRAGYSIEDKPCIQDEKIFFGAWDSYLYALSLKDGSLLWKTFGASSAVEKAKKYYSPADANPINVGTQIFVADRGYRLGVTDANNPNMREIASQTAAIALSSDKSAFFLRRVDNKLQKVKLTGENIWTIEVEAGRFPISPTVKDNIVLICSNKGLLNAINEINGSIFWQYQVTPQLYVMSEISVDEENVVVAGMDGSVTCLGLY